MGTRERLIQFVDYKGISKSKFYSNVGLSNGFLDKNNHIGSDKIEKIIYKFPELNLNWLITGEGEMIKNEDSMSILNEKGTRYNRKEEVSDNYDYLISELRKRVVFLEEKLNLK